MFKNLGENLTLLMDSIPMNAVELARETGIPMSTLKKIRTQVNTNPTLATLIPIAQYFSVTLDQMVMGNVKDSNKNAVSILPILDWKKASMQKQIPNQKNSAYIMSEIVFSANAFALRVERNEYSQFPLNSLLLIEPNQTPAHQNYVIVHLPKQDIITVKQYLMKENIIWIQSLHDDENAMPLSNEIHILGIVVECRMQLSSDEKYNKQN